jgi:hypothetical protein
VKDEVTPRAGLDSRVTDEDGLPVTERRLFRGWFTIRRADGRPSGVELIAKIPGYLRETSPHPTQSAAERAARMTYAGYRAAVRDLAETS